MGNARFDPVREGRAHDPVGDPSTCGVLRRPLRDYGWECYGRGLIVVMTWQGPNIPVVLPRRALEIVEPEPWWELPIRDFTGGDHAHLCVPRRPTDFKGDSVVMWGNVAVPMKRLGQVVGGGEIFIGPVEEPS